MVEGGVGEKGVYEKVVLVRKVVCAREVEVKKAL